MIAMLASVYASVYACVLLCLSVRENTHRLLYFDAFFDAFFFFLDGSNSEVEKAPFIAKPVRLTPAWEANNLPNDELNFRGADNYLFLALLFSHQTTFDMINRFFFVCFEFPYQF